MDYFMELVFSVLDFSYKVKGPFIGVLVVAVVYALFWGFLLTGLKHGFIFGLKKIAEKFKFIPVSVLASLGAIVFFLITSNMAVWMLEEKHLHGFLSVYLWALLIPFTYEVFQFNKKQEKGRTVSSVGGTGDTGESFGQPVQKPNYTFKDVFGMEALKAQLIEAARDNKSVGKNGILLSGDPGNGKTMIAEAFAGELGWSFVPITIGELSSAWVGVKVHRIQMIFNAAKQSNKLVLFFDECDSLLSDRRKMVDDGGAANQDNQNTVNAFLTGIVDLRRINDVIVIAATNYPDKLDEAATRDARFDFKIHVPHPDKEARHGLLLKFSSGVIFEEGVLDRLVRRWEGFSVARIRAIAEKIVMLAKKEGRKAVSIDQAFKALREVQGSLGGMVPEDTPTLKDGKLHFDPEQLKKLVSLASRMENIDEVERLGGQVPKGVLFYGPPGTGKTAVAKSLAKTSGWAFLATSGNQLLADDDAFAKLLKKARDLRPCIVFVDEGDDLLQNREFNPNPRAISITNRLLAEMDGVGQLHDVMFIAATNHPDKLDPAVTRGGRFGEHYEFKKPEENTVMKMVSEWLEGKKSTTPFHPEFTAETVGVMLNGLSPSDIKDKLQQAVNTGVTRMLAKEGEDVVMLSDLKAVL